GANLLRYDVMTKQSETVFNIASKMSGHTLWQAHSSKNDRVHSATVKNSSYASVGCMAFEEDSGKFHYFPRKGAFDECQIDKSGRYLLIKENVDGKDGEDNRIIDLSTGRERVLYDRDGAGGHSDMGWGYMIAADNFAANSNTLKVWDFAASTLSGQTTYYTNSWSAGSMAHVSHSNSVPGTPINQQFACGSSASSNTGPHSNEVVCVRLDGSRDSLVVAPVMTSMGASGG